VTRRVLYEILVNNKEKGGLGYKAKYSFKWIPDLRNTTTPRGASVEERSKISGAFRKGALERTALLNLLFMMFGVACAMYAGVQAAQKYGLVEMIARYSRLALVYASSRVSARA
jgi:hypothetical protein